MNGGVIFEDADLSLIWSPASRSDVVAVTFTPLGTGRPGRGDGFAQGFLKKRGIPSLCFVSRWDHWWLVPGMAEALRLAAGIAKGFPRVVTYGASMGGYGAIAFSKAVGATEVLAFSPQYSIDPRRVSFEQRWKHHAEKIDFAHEDLGPMRSNTAEIMLFYDPRSPDARHAALIDAERVRHFKAANVGHGVIGYLNAIGTLGKVVEAVLDGREIPLPADFLKRRREWSGYWKSVADQAIKTGRLPLAATCLEGALKVEPNSFGNTIKLAHVHERLRRPDRAAACYLKASEIRRGDHEVREKAFSLTVLNAKLLLREGEVRPALKAARMALKIDLRAGDAARRDEQRHLWRSLSDLCAGVEHLPLAVQCLERALKLEPTDFDALVRMGQLYKRLNQPERAVKFYSQALEIRADEPALREKALGLALAGARALLRQGQGARGFQVARMALRIDPGNEQARHLFRRARHLSKQEEAAA